MQGKTGGEALNGVLKYGGDAGRYGAQMTNALLGTSPHDLSRLISGDRPHLRRLRAAGGGTAAADRQLRRLHRRPRRRSPEPRNARSSHFAPALKTAHTSLVNLNQTLPPLRAYAIELTPAVAELPGLISAGEPWLEQARPLVSGKEGGGIARLLAEATPGLALCDEFGILVLEQRAGRARSEAWKNLSERTGVESIRNLVSVLVQSEQFGTSVAKTLRVHSDTMRAKRIQQV